MEIRNNDADKNKYFSAFMLLFSLAFYLFFAFFDGPVICVDSPSYITMDLTREPLYPLFLACFRFLFGSERYLFAVVLMQSILAALAAWSLASFMYREFHVNRAFSLLILWIPLAVSLLCRFAARRGSMYSNSILTEGITLSLYLLFFRFLLEYGLHRSRKAFYLCVFLSFLMISARKQMIVSLIMLIVVILYLSFSEKRKWPGFLSALLSCLAILLCNAGLDLSYNYLLRGEAVRHSGDTRFITTMAFYTADREDYRYLDDPGMQELFLAIYDRCEENGYLKHHAGKGWLNRVSHFGDHYDHIQIDTMWPMINAYAGERCGNDVVDINENTDLIMNIINTSVIPHHILSIAGTFFDNFLSGLVTTAAQMRSVLIGYSFFVFLLYLLLLCYHGYFRRNLRLCLFAALTLLSVFLNVSLVSLVIFCQTRYTIYNMPLFYISLLLMLYEPARKLLKQ